MIHYHGTPCGGERKEAARFLAGRNALVPWLRPEDIGCEAEVCQTFVLDNGAFTAWRSGQPILDWSGYYEWVGKWMRHPAFRWAIIPDVIDGDEAANDALVLEWPHGRKGVPVWHLHESIDRLVNLCEEWPTVALGSSGQWASVGTRRWWERMDEAMEAICYDGAPVAALHGLRMLDPAVFHRLPLASADSTNAVRNASNVKRFGWYAPPSLSARMATIADRIEAHQSAAVWVPLASQRVLFQEEVGCDG